MAKIKRSKSIPYNFSDKHLNYIRKCRDCSINVAEGAVRAGKTVDNILAFAEELKTHPNKLFLATGATAPNAKLNIGDCDGFGLEYIFRGQCRWGKFKGNDALIIKGADTKYQEKIVIFAGGSLANSYKKIRGNSYGMWIATEINNHHDNTIKEAFNRCLASKKRKTFWDLNPDNPKSFIYTDYIDSYAEKAEKNELLGGYNYEHFTIYDNINISEESKKEFISQYDPTSIWYMRDILGQRMIAEGLIFRSFAENIKTDKYIKQDKPTNIKYIFVGVDFGGNKSKTTFVASAVIGDFERLVVIKDHKVSGGKGEISPMQIENELIQFYRDLHAEYPSALIMAIDCDNEAQTLINGIRMAFVRAGYNVKIRDCYKAEINDRIFALSMLMEQGRFYVLSHCKNVIDSLATQLWDSKKVGKNVRLDDGTCDIDTADALEYTCSRYLKYFNVKR